LAILAKPDVKPLFASHPQSVLPAEAPLAEPTGDVPGLLEHFRNGHVFRIEVPVQPIIAYGSAAGVQASHQRTAGLSTDASATIDLGQPHSFRGQSVEVRRGDLLLSEAADVPVPQVVGQNEDHVGPTRLVSSSRPWAEHSKRQPDDEEPVHGKVS